jgi:hypothetical protein
MKSLKEDNIIKAYFKNRIQTPKGNKNYKIKEIINEKKAKSTKKFNMKDKNQILYSNQNNINAINIINNNYNNIYLDSKGIKQNKYINTDDKNYGIIISGNSKEKSLKKKKALKLIFNKSNKETFNANKYQFIINRLKNEIEFYKNKDNVGSNQIITNSPKSFRKKGFNKNLFLLTNQYNTIKTYDKKSIKENNMKNHNNNYNEAFNNNYIFDNKLTTDFSYKNNLNINNYNESNGVPKSSSNKFISIESNMTLKHMNKRSNINYLQNISSPGINKNNNYISNDNIIDDDNSNGKSSFADLYNNKFYLNKGFPSPLSLKKNIKNMNDNIYKYIGEKNNGNDLNESNYKDKFENLKNRMNKLVGNLFNIIEIQKNKLNKFNNK